MNPRSQPSKVTPLFQWTEFWSHRVAGRQYKDIGIAELASPATVLTLVDALVASSDGLLLLLDGDLAIGAVSESLCRAFDLEPARIIVHSILRMGDGEWNLGRLRSLLTAVASGSRTSPYELFFEPRDQQGTRCLEVYARKIAYDDVGVTRILVAITDTTVARAAQPATEQLIADKILLNRERQHRVANSLQIIASVLMQSASRVVSEETRMHLHQARNRVVSIAEVQRQLASIGAETVSVSPYLIQLCASIAASMIHDPKKVSLKVEVDGSEVCSDTSISLGLLVAELVINALKHAFSDDRSGTIRVDDAGNGTVGSWILEVADDGVGMPAAGDAPAMPGLGSSFVEALVCHQHARLTFASGNPGTIVSIRFDLVGTSQATVFPLGRAV